MIPSEVKEYLKKLTRKQLALIRAKLKKKKPKPTRK